MTHSNSSSSTSRNGVEWPAAAFATSTSRPPNASASSSITASGPGTAERSTWRCSTRTPSASHSATVSREVLLIGMPGEAEVEAAAREGDGGAAADAGVGAGDDCDGHMFCPFPVLGWGTLRFHARDLVHHRVRPRAGGRAGDLHDPAAGSGPVPRRDRPRLLRAGHVPRPRPRDRDRADHLLRRLRDAAGVVVRRRSASASGRSRWAGCSRRRPRSGSASGRSSSTSRRSQADALTQAAAGTAATVAGCGALGFALSKDLARWMRPLSLVVFAACIGTIIWSLAAGAVSPWVSALIYLLSAALIVRRLQLPAQARHGGRLDLARDRDLRLDREHLRLAPQHLRLVGSRGVLVGHNAHPG